MKAFSVSRSEDMTRFRSRFVPYVVGAAIAVASCSLLTAGHAMAQSTLLEKGEKEAVVEKVGDLLTVNYVFPDRAALAKAKITAALTAVILAFASAARSGKT